MDPVLARVGRYVVNRRVALGYKYRIDLAKELPITDRTLADIENGVREASLGTYAVLENKLGWVPGSIEAVRAGREPVEADAAAVQQQQQHQRPPLTTANPLKSVSTEELLLELRRRIIWDRGRWDSGEGSVGALIARGDGNETVF
ncbi:MAG: helix-turn-helix transcriptional regulator [Mycobacterium sp.]|nr:helix-turn-helix transcriptional regulator [Mycobacterium sp.]MBV9351950.1 helix-turn-helix transcriptional regulator [Mycobacterium sp.]